MRCPHGLEVGDPPLLTRCPLGFPGCHCGDDLVAFEEQSRTRQPDPEATATFDWWNERTP